MTASQPTSQWLHQLGAVRPPMAPVSVEILVLGRFHEGYYPITWTCFVDEISRDINGNLMLPQPQEQWMLFGVAIHGQLTRGDCERILEQLRTDDMTNDTAKGDVFA